MSRKEYSKDYLAALRLYYEAVSLEKAAPMKKGRKKGAKRFFKRPRFKNNEARIAKIKEAYWRRKQLEDSTGGRRDDDIHIRRG